MITITEALAELKLINSKIEKKKQFILTYLGRQEGAKDPLEKSGGSSVAIASEMQSIKDLSERFIRIRSAIASANAANVVEILGVKYSVADWLIWRRSVAPMVQGFEQSIMNGINNIRNRARQQNVNVVKPGEEAKNLTDVLIEIDEMELSKRMERTQEILDNLDGKLSLHNATVQIDV